MPKRYPPNLKFQVVLEVLMYIRQERSNDEEQPHCSMGRRNLAESEGESIRSG
jgi:hypothetical protein